MALLTTQTVVPGGTTPAYVAANAGGDTVTPGNDTFLHAKNASGGSLTVTVDSVTPCNYGSDHDLVVAIPAGSERMIGPLPASRFASPTTGLVSVTYSGVTSLTVAAIRTGVS
jgi:hypothetical protein